MTDNCLPQKFANHDGPRGHAPVENDPNISRGKTVWGKHAEAVLDLYTPLHRATARGDVEMCQLLLDADADADVSHPGLDGWTPLHLACWERQEAVVALFLHTGVGLDALDWYANKAEHLDAGGECRYLFKRRDFFLYFIAC